MNTLVTPILNAELLERNGYLEDPSFSGGCQGHVVEFENALS